MIEQITGFLGDNALTRSWGDSVGRGVNWVERQVLSDEDLRQVIGNAAGRGQVGDVLSDESLALLSRLSSAPIDRSKFDAAMAAHEAGPADLVARQAVSRLSEAGVRRDQLKALAAELQSPQNQRTEAAHVAQMVLGHPVAAYSAVSAGGALGVAGGMEAYDWWMAQQQQAEKESQLPLS